MKKLSSENTYLITSIFLSILLPFSFFETGTNLSFSSPWLPIWIFGLLIPFYGIVQITKFTDDWNLKYWIGLILNLLNFFFVNRFFSINLW
ncbi:hypothetical protein [Flavobacterium haoranii]|uniref:Uncharacterized protein n=1 Tax=Flavobacterium haoranii TaxID=683124 RepID=A0A1M6KYK5_9FLAO|nr:hypothetical protein [Flavobacterium haoranii]SHJ64030.1 hypothetical protein SAMN05444337_2334 [Flavobacterium haoranii]